MSLINIDQDHTISTIDLLEAVNEARTAAGETEIRNNDFVARVEDELEDENPVTKLSRPTRGGTPQRYYDLTKDQALQVGMRESKAVRRSVLNKLNQAYAAVNEAEARLQITDQDLAPKYSALTMWRGFLSPKSNRALKRELISMLYNMKEANPTCVDVVKSHDDKRDFILAPHLALVALQVMFKAEEARHSKADLMERNAQGGFDVLAVHRDALRAEISGEHPSMGRLTAPLAIH